MRSAFILAVVIVVVISAISAGAQDNVVYPQPYAAKYAEMPYDPFITAYAGTGYYYWNDLSGLIESSGEKAVEQKVEPYVMKKFYVKADLWIFNAGIEYLTSRFTDMGNITEEQSAEEQQDPLARYMRFFSGLQLGGVELKGNLTYRKFQGALKSLGMKPYDGTPPILPVLYYPANGPKQELAKGDEAPWSTVVRDYEIVLSIPMNERRRRGMFTSYEIGGRYTSYSAPQKLRFTDPEAAPGDTYFSAVMQTTYHIYSLSVGYRTRYQTISDVYVEFYAPGVFGFHRFENDYLDARPKYPFNFTATGRGHLCLGYDLKHVRLEGGIDYTYYCSYSKADVKLKEDIDYYSERTGDPVTLTQGSKAEVSAMRLELFWGVYLQAYILF
ncbi:MAG: hypothetical protein MUC76_12270 [Spirochaetes bacterium]|jgi:hypothetical protein|nr:hypothetical protein [Spirochaetota bacterium]HSV95926.1 hypothetical protein [Spirochaetota bacterium]